MEFVYNDLDYKKEQILHATVHLDEKTPHIHCVVVPLRYMIKELTLKDILFLKNNILKIQLSQLQDKYRKRLTDKVYYLD